MLNESIELMQRATAVIPGGVNSPVRAFKAVGGNPIFFERGNGAHIYDVDGNEYIDYVGSWGPLILGHAHPKVVQAIQKIVQNGTSFGAPTRLEVEIAELITNLMPSIETIRMVNSGTEATMSAIRLARGYTGKKYLVKFDNCYHGHSDPLLVKAGSGALTLGVAGSAGVVQDLAEYTLIAPYNDLQATAHLFAEYGHDIAAVIVEPIAANNNLIMPTAEFLPGLRKLCDEHNSLLIFDEVITGFRVALGGAQELYGIAADITCLGKIVGGGMPVGAFGGRRDILAMLAPIGPVYQAGTLSGNPVALTAGITTLQELIAQPNCYTQLQQYSANLMQQLTLQAKQHGITMTANYISGLFGFNFVDDPDNKFFKSFFHLMLQQGIYLAPSAYEAGFVSLAHNEITLSKTITAAQQCFALMQKTDACALA